jgi:hypothetical protein
MKALLLLLLAMSIPAAAQSADAIYQQACGPKEALFDVKTGQETGAGGNTRARQGPGVLHPG